MKTLKKTLCLVLAVVMSLSLVTVAGAEFDDVEADNDYAEAIEVMSAIGVINGVGGDKFKPEGTLTRAQAAKIITYMVLGPDVAEELPNDTHPFADVPAGFWAAGSIAYLKEIGAVNGRDNKNYDPDDTVTGYEFGKMVLEAAGIEGEYTGSAWTINVARALNGKDLAVDGVLMSQPLTRGAAAQMAFNGLNYTATGNETGRWILDVDTTKEESSNPGITALKGMDGEVFNSKSEGIIVVGTICENAKYSDDYSFIAEKDNAGSLAAEVFNKLHDSPSKDAFGRPTTVWTNNDGVEVTINSDPILEYTTAVTGGKLYTDLGMPSQTDLDVTHIEDGKTNNSFDETDIKSGFGGSDHTIGGYGALTQVYQTGYKTYTVVTVNTYVSTVNRHNDAVKNADGQITSKENITLSTVADTTSAPAGGLYSNTFATSDFTEDDEGKTVVLYTAAYRANDPDTAADEEGYYIQSAVPATSETLTATRVITNPASFVANDTTYQYSAKHANEVGAGDVTGKAPKIIYFDQYGYAVLVVDPAGDSAKYAVILNYDYTNSAIQTVTKATLLLTDGTVVTVDMYAVNGGAAYTIPKDQTLVGNIVTYSVRSDGSYNVDFANAAKTVMLEDDAEGKVEIKTNKNILEMKKEKNSNEVYATKSYNVDAKTVFLVDNGDGTYSAYAGIAQVPNLELAIETGDGSKDGAWIGIRTDDTAATHAGVVFVQKATDKGAANTITNEIFLLQKTSDSVTDVDAGTYSTWSVILNGEQGSLNIADDASPAAGKLYSGMVTNKNNIVTSLTTLTTAGSTIVAIGNDETAAWGYGSPANDVIMLDTQNGTKNGSRTTYDEKATVVYVVNGNSFEVADIGALEGGDMGDTIVGYTTNGVLSHLYVIKTADYALTVTVKNDSEGQDKVYNVTVVSPVTLTDGMKIDTTGIDVTVTLTTNDTNDVNGSSHSVSVTGIDGLTADSISYTKASGGAAAKVTFKLKASSSPVTIDKPITVAITLDTVV